MVDDSVMYIAVDEKVLENYLTIYVPLSIYKLEGDKTFERGFWSRISRYQIGLLDTLLLSYSHLISLDRQLN